MFCSKCGAKIQDGSTQCRQCGTPAEYAEYCGGFWNLVGQSPKNGALEKQAGNAPNPKQETVIKDLRQKVRRSRRTSRILLIVCLILLCFSIVLGACCLWGYGKYRAWREYYRSHTEQTETDSVTQTDPAEDAVGGDPVQFSEGHEEGPEQKLEPDENKEAAKEEAAKEEAEKEEAEKEEAKKEAAKKDQEAEEKDKHKSKPPENPKGKTDSGESGKDTNDADDNQDDQGYQYGYDQDDDDQGYQYGYDWDD